MVCGTPLEKFVGKNKLSDKVWLVTLFSVSIYYQALHIALEQHNHHLRPEGKLAVRTTIGVKVPSSELAASMDWRLEALLYFRTLGPTAWRLWILSMTILKRQKGTNPVLSFYFTQSGFIEPIKVHGYSMKKIAKNQLWLSFESRKIWRLTIY